MRARQLIRILIGIGLGGSTAGHAQDSGATPPRFFMQKSGGSASSANMMVERQLRARH